MLTQTQPYTTPTYTDTHTHTHHTPATYIHTMPHTYIPIYTHTHIQETYPNMNTQKDSRVETVNTQKKMNRSMTVMLNLVFVIKSEICKKTVS